MKSRILSEWNSYRRAVLHPDSPDNQVNDLKNAFYGGAVTIFNVITKISESLSENKATRALEELHREFARHSDEANKVAERKPRKPRFRQTQDSCEVEGNVPGETRRVTEMGIRAVISNQTEPVPVTGTLGIEEWGFAAWDPTPDGTGSLEQMWLNFQISGITEAKFAIRFKTREAWERFAAMGDGIADQVWPDNSVPTPHLSKGEQLSVFGGALKAIIDHLQEGVERCRYVNSPKIDNKSGTQKIIGVTIAPIQWERIQQALGFARSALKGKPFVGYGATETIRLIRDMLKNEEMNQEQKLRRVMEFCDDALKPEISIEQDNPLRGKGTQ